MNLYTIEDFEKELKLLLPNFKWTILYEKYGIPLNIKRGHYEAVGTKNVTFINIYRNANDGTFGGHIDYIESIGNEHVCIAELRRVKTMDDLVKNFASVISKKSEQLNKTIWNMFIRTLD